MDKRGKWGNPEKTKEFYRRRIIEMVGEIESIWILEQILQFVQNMTKED